MGSRGTFDNDWDDRVAGKDEPLDDAPFAHVESFVNDALELVQQVIEASIEPLIDIATEIRGSRAGAWWRARTGAWSDRDGDAAPTDGEAAR